MKIFRFFSNIDLSSTLENMPFQVLPDTALLIQKRPFFIPDFTEDCKVQFCYAVRINRLGRSIHEKFAHRYYDASAITLGVHFVACDLLASLQASGKPWDVAVGFDNAVAVSEHKATDFLNADEATLQIQEVPLKSAVNRDLPRLIDQQIARISAYYTLKQGDILLFPVEVDAQQVEIDNHISLFLDSEEVLSFNVK